jgi:hypothetical protein
MKNATKKITIGLAALASGLVLGGCLSTTNRIIPAIADYGPYALGSQRIYGLPLLPMNSGFGLAAERDSQGKINIYHTPAETGECMHFSVDGGYAKLEGMLAQFKLQARTQGIGHAMANIGGETYLLRMVAQENAVYKCRIEGMNVVDEEVLTLLSSQDVESAVALLASDWVNRGLLDLALIIVDEPVHCSPFSDKPSRNRLKVVLYKNDGHDNFTRQGIICEIPYSGGATKFGAAAVDVDGDTDTDIIFKEADKDFARVYHNLSLGF